MKLKEVFESIILSNELLFIKNLVSGDSYTNILYNIVMVHLHASYTQYIYRSSLDLKTMINKFLSYLPPRLPPLPPARRL